ncbi:hypothetical protein EYF80_064459 [Liparis tanakae]|uniref:Uncharacterized protein n=1 Tax=Liparis tanakae TaxID=230148 RepID=A0A4Z2EAX7_9TELE|nr:hypothetical protein EYF80_064459 [Liparis tanakae]
MITQTSLSVPALLKVDWRSTKVKGLALTRQTAQSSHDTWRGLS